MPAAYVWRIASKQYLFMYGIYIYSDMLDCLRPWLSQCAAGLSFIIHEYDYIIRGVAGSKHFTAKKISVLCDIFFSYFEFHFAFLFEFPITYIKVGQNSEMLEIEFWILKCNNSLKRIMQN